MRKWVALLLLAVPPMTRASDVVMDDTTKKATAKALEWIAAKQNADGSWSEGRYPHSTAITALSLLAFMSQGHLPGQGLYGPEVAKGTRFLVSAARQSDGYLVGSRGGNMYCHGLATLALAELWGMTGDAEVKQTLTRAVDLIVKTQNREGGWRYDPAPTGADISVTIMQVMALRAAKNSGLHVPDVTMKQAIAYIKSCYVPSQGGFVYQPFSSKTGFARSAAGVCVLQLAGEYDAREIPKAVAYLKENFNAREYFWYGHYYAAHAMHQIGGKEWEDWYARIRTTFLALQSDDGSWSRAASDKEGVGPVYTTSIAVIALSVPASYLPIFQR
ncbi:MAG: prenyltransferase/squalene oxidase repeat-containing protein [Gemmataceae bacterium]